MLDNEDLNLIANHFGQLEMVEPANTMIEDVLAEIMRQREKIKGLQGLIRVLCHESGCETIEDLRKFIALRRSISDGN